MNKHNPFHSSPLILALETATSCGSVALISPRNCLAEYSQLSDLTHSRRLCSTIEELMGESSVEWQDVDAVAVSLGPGSFTGLRIGLSVAKGIALATGKPLVGVATLDALAHQVQSVEGSIYPVLDARKKEVYTACYRCDGDGIPRRVSDYLVISPESFESMIEENALFLGDGVTVCSNVFDTRDIRATTLPPAVYFPRASHVGFLAIESFMKEDVMDTATAAPIYVRPSEAEIKFPNGTIGKGLNRLAVKN